MTRQYFGCENAASATAKVELFNKELGRVVQTLFFGDVNDMWDYLDQHESKGKKYYYLREVLNWETGRLGGWQIQKSNWG